MYTPTLFLTVLSLIACISAASFQPLLGPRVPIVSPASVGQALDKRQIPIGSESSAPSQCSSTCSLVDNEVSLGCPVTACCTTTFETQYYNCLECVGIALNMPNFTTAQNSLNLLYTTCVDMGFVLPRMFLPGQTNSSTSASAPASTGSSSAPTSPGTAATGAAACGRWCGVRIDLTLISTAVLLGVAGLW